jgi:hypothetical protein
MHMDSGTEGFDECIIYTWKQHGEIIFLRALGKRINEDKD